MTRSSVAHGTFALEPAAEGGTRLTITERGVVRPPLLRALSRYVIGHHRSMERIHGMLAGSLDAPVTVERVTEP